MRWPRQTRRWGPFHCLSLTFCYLFNAFHHVLAQAIFDAFHLEVKAAKAAIAKAKAAGGGDVSTPPVEPQLLKEMLAYYNEYNPAFANEPKCSGIARTFMKKAKTAGAPETWKEMLYAALGAKDGCDDPREVLARSTQAEGGGGGGEPEAEAPSSGR